MRRVRATENRLGQDKPGDPVEELAREMLEREARSELRYAKCPQCDAKNPEGLAADRADQRQSQLLGLGLFGVLAVVAWFYPNAALIFPGMDLLIFRPMMVVYARKMSDKPFPTGVFIAGILVDILLIAVILLVPRGAFLIPIVGILRSLFTSSSKHEGRWEEAEKKIRFEVRQEPATRPLT